MSTLTAYNYLAHMEEHISLDEVFIRCPVFPRQIQVHLPGRCNFHCNHCVGQKDRADTEDWVDTGYTLLEKLGDRIPVHNYSGASTEPLNHPCALDFLKLTKRNGCKFGIKTNGSRLIKLEKLFNFMTVLCDISDTPQDFISISLDAGDFSSFKLTKCVDPIAFQVVRCGVQRLVEIRGSRNSPAIRVSYLLNELNNSRREISAAIDWARMAGVDSIRFAQPHPIYGMVTYKARDWWSRIERRNDEYLKRFEEFSSESVNDKPFVFYVQPAPVPAGGFDRCGFGYYQITLGHDGYVYRCTSMSTKTFAPMRLGKIPDDPAVLLDMIHEAQDPDFNPQKCFQLGGYCCRAGLAVNEALQRRPRC